MLNANPVDAAGFLVHNYTYIDHVISDDINATALGMIHAATSLSDWSDVGKASFVKYERISTTYVEYKPPGDWSRSTGVVNATVTLKNWGSPIDRDDIFSLDLLEEFKSTDISSCFSEKIKHHIVPSVAPIELPSTAQENHQHLYSVIPQPHIHPSSLTRSPGPSQLLPYQKMKPIPIAPCMGAIPALPYTRCAWLIPVRGSFPWDQCTSAIILEPSSIIPVSPKGDRPITWTNRSLQSLWELLLTIKKKGTAGTIGISFQVSRDSKPAEPNTNSSTMPTVADNQCVAEGSVVSLQGTTSTAHRIQLSNVDHIKIYHEATYAMHLRNILHLWSYVIPPDAQSVLKKVRVLRGARLALVDERSRGILLS